MYFILDFGRLYWTKPAKMMTRWRVVKNNSLTVDWLPPRGSGDWPLLKDENDLPWISSLQKVLGAAQRNNTRRTKIRKAKFSENKTKCVWIPKKSNFYVRAESRSGWLRCLFPNILLRYSTILNIWRVCISLVTMKCTRISSCQQRWNKNSAVVWKQPILTVAVWWETNINMMQMQVKVIKKFQELTQGVLNKEKRILALDFRHFNKSIFSASDTWFSFRLHSTLSRQLSPCLQRCSFWWWKTFFFLPSSWRCFRVVFPRQNRLIRRALLWVSWL